MRPQLGDVVAPATAGERRLSHGTKPVLDSGVAHALKAQEPSFEATGLRAQLGKLLKHEAQLCCFAEATAEEPVGISKAEADAWVASLAKFVQQPPSRFNVTRIEPGSVLMWIEILGTTSKGPVGSMGPMGNLGRFV